MSQSSEEYFMSLNPSLRKALGEIMRLEKTTERVLGSYTTSFGDELISIINRYSKEWNEEEK
jgi:hypothetical protein